MGHAATFAAAALIAVSLHLSRKRAVTCSQAGQIGAAVRESAARRQKIERCIAMCTAAGMVPPLVIQQAWEQLR